MPTRLDARYRAKLAALHDRVRIAVNRLYAASVDPDDLDASFAEFSPRAAVVVQAGQSRGVSLATGYLAALVTLSVSRRVDFSGITSSVRPAASLTEGMAAWPSMVKEQIGKGVEVPQAIEYGRYLAERFADNEITAAVDRQTNVVTRQSGEFSGWAGILTGRETCEPCKSNEGFHALEEPFYRHPGCDCTREYLVAG